MNIEKPNLGPVKMSLDNMKDREVIQKFEEELNGRTFDQYCLDEKLISRNPKYSDIAINFEKLEKYNIAKEKNELLEQLKKRRFFIKKQQHMNDIGDQSCACRTFCKPLSIAEIFQQHKQSFQVPACPS
jgi:hypothetical protein